MPLPLFVARAFGLNINQKSEVPTDLPGPIGTASSDDYVANTACRLLYSDWDPSTRRNSSGDANKDP